MTKLKDSGVSALLESLLNQILQAETIEQLKVEPNERKMSIKVTVTAAIRISKPPG